DVYVPDDNARAQRMQAGGINGTVLPPVLARTFEDTAGMRVDAVQSADWRGVSLPAGNPFTRDEQARLAMNLGVDRQSMIDNVLAGHGRPAYTPVADVYGDGVNPDATFNYDPNRARTLLDTAGWVPGDNGIRTRDGDRAEFTIYYPANDTLRRDLAAAFASDMHTIGIDVHLQGSSWDEIDEAVDTSGVLLAAATNPTTSTHRCTGLCTPAPATPPPTTTPPTSRSPAATRRSTMPAAASTRSSGQPTTGRSKTTTSPTRRTCSSRSSTTPTCRPMMGGIVGRW
ncbi:MAG: ABC transporter substrate-binding protein, partial [Tomitella sp.]|nr:ABC transporter substrate-binding protein [Tomitella sp.]